MSWRFIKSVDGARDLCRYVYIGHRLSSQRIYLHIVQIE